MEKTNNEPTSRLSSIALATADAVRPPARKAGQPSAASEVLSASYAGSSCAASEILSARHTPHPAYSSHTSLSSFRPRPILVFQLFPSTSANSHAGLRYKCNKCKNGLNLVFNWNTPINNKLQQNRPCPRFTYYVIISLILF
jgi:hypothetical protein